MRTRIVLLLLAVLALAACATPPRYYNDGYRSACNNCGTIERIERVYGERETTGGGAVLGAIIGGALGNQVGKGDGRKAATVAGAVIGGAVGRDIDRRNNPRRPVTEYQTQCHIEPSWHPVRMYDVTWRDRGRLHTERMEIHPGTHVRVYE